ncbi:MAG: hypothetical protein CM15mP103_08840 [Gammaproteobacteria bacterium]|nr:MAG: hypothetical protein CM15mP103_08840 [Gammaproteobacteria bacterium]
MTTTVTPPQLSGGYSSGFGYAYSVFNLVEPALDGTGSRRGSSAGRGSQHPLRDRPQRYLGLFMTRTRLSFEIQKAFWGGGFGGVASE